MHTRVKFTKGHEDGDAAKGWHLLTTLADGEYTACGLATTEYQIEQQERESGGITCQNCLDTIRYYKTIKL